MGKKRHSKDKMYITVTELKMEWGGKKDPSKAPIAKLPFHCCSLTMQPFKDPVCSPDGCVFDLVNIVPYLRKYGRNPVTGKPLKMSQLVQLKLFKNKKTRNFQCPIALKDFTPSTKIVAIRTSGNVYSSKVVDELNRKQKNWTDLLTGEKFKSKDIIVLQDPLNIANRVMIDFWWRKVGRGPITQDIDDDDKLAPIELTGLGKRAMKEAEERGNIGEEIHKKLKVVTEAPKPKIKRSDLNPDDLLTVKQFLEERKAYKDWRHGQQTTGRVAASVTSSVIDVRQTDELRILRDAEMLERIWRIVKSHHIKTYVQIKTNLGNLSCILFSDQAARTCFSFLNLIYEKKLKGLKFEKLIEGTIAQIGFYSKGMKFDTVDKSEKLKHDRGGLLTVETTGDVSTFGITLALSTQLDYSYSVFGRIVGGFDIIQSISQLGSNGEDMKADFKIIDVEVISDAFQEGCRKLRRGLLGIDKKKEKEIKAKVKKKERNLLLSKILML